MIVVCFGYVKKAGTRVALGRGFGHERRQLMADVIEIAITARGLVRTYLLHSSPLSRPRRRTYMVVRMSSLAIRLPKRYKIKRSLAIYSRHKEEMGQPISVQAPGVFVRVALIYFSYI